MSFQIKDNVLGDYYLYFVQSVAEFFLNGVDSNQTLKLKVFSRASFKIRGVIPTLSAAKFCD